MIHNLKYGALDKYGLSAGALVAAKPSLVCCNLNAFGATGPLRERQVLRLVVSGLRNKQSASELGISGFTLQIHRGQVMQKMRARSLADLVRMAEILKVPYYGSPTFTEGQHILAAVRDPDLWRPSPPAFDR